MTVWRVRACHVCAPLKVCVWIEHYFFNVPVYSSTVSAIFVLLMTVLFIIQVISGWYRVYYRQSEVL